jgi:hypothetical protein
MSSPHCARLSLQHSIFPLLRRLTRRTNHDQIPLCTKTPVYRSIRLMKTPLRNATLIDFLDAGGHSNRPPNRLVPNTKEFTHSKVLKKNKNWKVVRRVNVKNLGQPPRLKFSTSFLQSCPVTLVVRDVKRKLLTTRQYSRAVN